MIKPENLRIDPDSLGSTLVLTDVKPWYEYDNGRRVETPSGKKYTVACKAHGFEKITVKVRGNSLPEFKEDAFPHVVFEGLQIKIYVIEGAALIVAEATAIKKINADAAKKA